MNVNIRKIVPDLIAALVVVTFIGYVGLAITGLFGTSLAAMTAVWMTLYATVVLMSAVKLYGKGPLEAVRNAGGKIVRLNEPTTEQEQ